MKKTIISAVVFASMFVVGAVPNAQAGQCSNASLEGVYGFWDGHTLVPAGTPFAALGRWNFDGRGNFTSTLTINDNGTVTHRHTECNLTRCEMFLPERTSRPIPSRKPSPERRTTAATAGSPSRPCDRPRLATVRGHARGQPRRLEKSSCRADGSLTGQSH